MAISIIDPGKDPRWDLFVAGHPGATVYHSSAWAWVLASTYGYRPRYVVAEDGTGRVRAGLPLFLVRSRLTGRRLVCLPFSDHCWPLTSSQDDVLLLLGTAQRMIVEDRASYLELRGWMDGEPPAEIGLVSHRYYYRHMLHLNADPEQVRRCAIDENMRRSIRMAERSGVVVRRAETDEDVRAFQRLDLMTRRKHGALPHPAALLRNIHRLMGHSGQGFLLLAFWEGKVIAGTLFLAFGSTVCYKYNASDPSHLKKCPNHLLMWKGIEQGCLSGCHQLDLGRSDPEHESLRDYKRRWGAKEAELPYFYYPAVRGVGATKSDSSQARALAALIRRLPNAALEAAGTLLYPHLG